MLKSKGSDKQNGNVSDQSPEKSETEAAFNHQVDI